jgi:hypothetical protein
MERFAHPSMHWRARSMLNTETREEGADTSRSVAHYRVRAYRDALIIVVAAVVCYFIFMRVDLVNYIISWMHRMQPWELDAFATLLLMLLAGSFVFIIRRRTDLLEEIGQRTKLEEEQAHLINQLEEAIANIRTLSGLVPICGWCKKIRDDQGYWIQVEAYLQSHTNAKFTHGICPDCAANVRNAQEAKSPA